MISESYFRSLSLIEDLSKPERFAHYRPTRRAAPIVEAVLKPRAATMVIAPYGSGKSLAAGVGALAVRGRDSDMSVVRSITASMTVVAPDVARRLEERLDRGAAGKVAVLSGYHPDPLAAIARQLGLPKAPAHLEGLVKAIATLNVDHVAIVWDEFGRHLEGLVADGRTADMDLLQRLGERAARANGPTLSFTLLLHQNLLAYASRLNETTRSEWRKIEGRFDVLRLVEDSQEIYALVADVVTELRGSRVRGKVTPELVKRVSAARWLDGMENPAAVEQVLLKSRPLTAGALQILPALLARVGQNERSLFSFLREMDLGRVVGIEQVYAAFADAMRTDVGIGGSYRRWVEAESARSRAKDGLQRELIAAACLLQLGVSGERLRLPRDVLELAVLSDQHVAEDVSQAVDDLIAAKLLLWRRHNDDVAVWHGADIDVGLRVREERDRLAGEFSLTAFLEARFPAPNVRTPGHNARYGVNRMFQGHYSTLATLKDVATASPVGSIIYVLAMTRAEIDEARAFASTARNAGRVFVVPQRPVEAGAAALELVALEALRTDADFVASDPMVSTELDELQSVAFEQLAASLRPLLSPRGPAADWWAQGRRLEVTHDRPGGMAASELFDAWYSDTPRIENDQLMRDQASRTMQTARIRIISGILERSDRLRLGLPEDDRSAEGSIYRTVFEKTGLRREEDRRFAFVHEVTASGLAITWQVIADFFQTPTDGFRLLSELTDRLRAMPIGAPGAIIPLLVAAGYRQFARTVVIYRNGIYEPDLLGFQFDQMVTQPHGFTVRVVAADLRFTDYLRELCYAFLHEYPKLDDELFRSAYDAMRRWRVTVPEGARRTEKLDDVAKLFLNAVSTANDPLELVLQRLPAIFDAGGPDLAIIPKIEQARKSIDGLRDIFAEEAVSTACEAFRLRRDSTGDLITTVRDWAVCFEGASLLRTEELRISDRAILGRAVETANGRFSPKSFAGALSSILLKCGLEKWDDRSAAEFRTALREARERIEAAAIQGPLTANLRPLLRVRIDELQERLNQLDAADASGGRYAQGSKA